MKTEEKLPWPGDAVMLVCAKPSEALTQHMESVNPAKCRDCGADVVYDGRTARLAEPMRFGRPLDFFCIDCAVQHDVQSVDRLEDHRGGKHEVLWSRKPFPADL